MRVLLSGAAGFVGSHVRDALPDGWDVLCPGMPGTPIRGRVREWVEWDLRTTVPRTVMGDRYDVIVSVASEADPATATIRGNHAIGVRVAEVAAAWRCPIVHVSTEEVYGDPAPGADPFTPASPLNPVSVYAEGKASQEVILRRHAADTGLPVTILVTGSVFGARQPAPRLIPTLARATVQGTPMPLVDGSRQWTYAPDLATAIVEAASEAADMDGFTRTHVIGHETIRHADLAALAGAVLDRPAVTTRRPMVPPRPGAGLHRPIQPGTMMPCAWPSLARTIREVAAP